VPEGGEVVRVIGYTRVSTNEQAQKGLGLPIQKQAIVDFCRQQGHELLEVFEDGGVSGTYALHERPALRDAYVYVEERRRDPLPVGALVVARWDRFARDTLVSLVAEQEFKRLGSDVLSADGIGVDQTTRELFAVLASAERRNLVARLKAGRAAKAAAGGYSGGRPAYGYEAVGGGLVVYEAEAKVVRQIFLWVSRDRWTLSKVARKLNERGTPGRRHWSDRDVHVVLKREAYKLGSRPVVDPRVWNKANAVLAARRRGGRVEQAAA
jgi:site-specific DNA recombinase